MSTMPFVTKSCGTPSGILMFPDEYQAKAQTFLPNDATAATVNGRKIVRAGTIWPANSAAAKGVVLYDVDVTDGTGTGALLFEGSIKTSKLPAVPDAAAVGALPRITFFGNALYGVASITITGLVAPVTAALAVDAEDLTVSVGNADVVSLVWAPVPVSGAFAADKDYVAVVTIIPKTGYILGSALEATIATATEVSVAVLGGGSSATLTCTFPKTVE